MERQGKPGVMFYFDIRPCIKRLTMVEKGKLFEAILDYGELGVLPEFDGMLGLAWDFIVPRLDRDSEQYETKVKQRRFAVYVRESRKQGITPASFDEWASLSDNERERMIAGDVGCYPTSTSESTPASTPTPTSTKCMADKPPTPSKAKYGKFGWVQLTQDEYTRLVADLGETEAMRCIAYVDESAQSTGNKNKWRDWNLVARKCHRDGWGLSKPTPARGGTPVPDYDGGAKWSL